MSDTNPGVETLGILALRVAESELARGAGEVGGNNRGADIELYLNFDSPRTRRPGDEWCAGFVSYCYKHAEDSAGRPGTFPGSISAERLRMRCATKGWYYSRLGAQLMPRPGDVIWMGKKDSASHVGIVRAYDTATGTVTTIEGNAGLPPCKVMVKSYTPGTDAYERILGWAHVE